MSFFNTFSRTRFGSGSTSGSRTYGGSGTTGGYTGSSGYGTSGYGAGSYGNTSSYSSSNYAQPRGAGSGISGYGGSSYGSGIGSGYTSAYSTNNSSYNPSSYSSSYTSRPARDYDSGSSYGSGSTYEPSYGASRRSASVRDRSSERASTAGNLYTPRNERRASNDTRLSGGLKKSSSYSGLHWLRDNSIDRYDKDAKKSATDSVIRSHRRQGSGSSIASYDAVFEDAKSVSRSGSQKKKQEKRDLETILGREDHILVQRIIEENKELFQEAQANLELSPQEKRLIQSITDATRYGNAVNHLDILQIIESH